VAVGLDMEIVEVDAAKDDAGIRGSRLKAEFSVNAGMETDAVGFDRAMDSGLKHGRPLNRVAHCRPNNSRFVLYIQLDTAMPKWENLLPVVIRLQNGGWACLGRTHGKAGLPAGAGYPSEALARPNRMVYSEIVFQEDGAE